MAKAKNNLIEGISKKAPMSKKPRALKKSLKKGMVTKATTPITKLNPNHWEKLATNPM
jgi:hypothetical protein